ncbi:NAD-dependent epimerase/dehydratase family protein [Patescibacteria group bacterium]|nr:NAD-dependent epimerase/dehydratase family protein [Patescibacteria group bacterium]
MKILVTGGCGFIGSHIVDAYIKLGHEVIIADKRQANLLPYKNPSASYFQINLTKSKEINKLIEDEKPDVINHHAANISVTNSLEKPLNDANNITSVINLLEAAKKYKVKKIIFASSAGAIYSEDKTLPFTEKTQPFPITPYGVSKLAGEYYIKAYSKICGIKYVILRYSNVYGPRQNNKNKSVISIFIENIINGKRLTINNNGDQTRDFIFVSDLVYANVLALKYDINNCFNISSQTETSIKDLSKKIKGMFNSEIKIKYKKMKSIEQNRSYISNKKALKELKWKPKVTLKQGLIETVKWYERNFKN